MFSVDKPASWSGDTPGLSETIDEILAAGFGKRVYMSAGGYQGKVGLAAAHPWRQDSRIVILDEGSTLPTTSAWASELEHPMSWERISRDSPPPSRPCVTRWPASQPPSSSKPASRPG